jgi:predicted  nucleic acid-binding Zn-ribbon protein
MANPLLVIVALAAILAAVFLYLWGRQARTTLAGRDVLEGQLRAELEAARKAAADVRTEAKDRKDEAAQLRADLDRAKKRAFEQLDAAKRAGGAQAIREELDKVTSRLAEARAEADHQRERVRVQEQEVVKANQAAEKVREQLAQAKARAEAPAPAPAAPPPPPAAAAGADPAKLQAEKERADKAEARATELRKRIAELERDLKGARGRLETEKRVYIVQKGELELAADRYAEMRRRHEALRKDHDELVEAVRQAAREERRLTQQEAARADKQTKPAAPEGETEGEQTA